MRIQDFFHSIVNGSKDMVILRVTYTADPPFLGIPPQKQYKTRQYGNTIHPIWFLRNSTLRGEFRCHLQNSDQKRWKASQEIEAIGDIGSSFFSGVFLNFPGQNFGESIKILYEVFKNSNQNWFPMEKLIYSNNDFF
jgi:hypothetical protein